MRSGAGILREHDLRFDGEGNGRCEVPSLCKVGQLLTSTMPAAIFGSHYQHYVWVNNS